MQIEIDVPRPALTLAVLVAIGWGVYQAIPAPSAVTASATGVQSSSSVVSAPVASSNVGAYADDVADLRTAQGGDDTFLSQDQKGAEDDVRRGRLEQEMIKRKAEILRGQLKILEAEKQALGDQADPALEEQLAQSTQILISLQQDQRKAEQFLLSAFNDMWDAQDRAMALADEAEASDTVVSLQWPLEPTLGLSAHFDDPSYEARFGFPHHAIDIPVLQGSPVRAAGDGVVQEVSDHGLGFNSITIKHAGGVATLYGHISKFLVKEGQKVKAGDVIGLSGGRPGTAGAGLSTGPHLHFAVFKSGVAVDPLSFLPSSSYTDAVEETE